MAMTPTGKMPWDNLIDSKHYKTCGVTKRRICFVEAPIKHEPLSREFEEILYDNLWELMVHDDPNSVMRKEN